MNKPVRNKEEFIFNMLNYATKENSDPKLKERVLKLICREEKNRSNQNKLKHDPLNMIEFLKRFTKDDTFKYFTHDWDARGDFDIKFYLENAKKEFSKILKEQEDKYTYINKNTYITVKNYLFAEDESKFWLDYEGKKIFYSWQRLINEKKIITENPKIIELNYNKEGVELKYFLDFIKRFKNTIEFRTDAPPKLFSDFFIRKIVKEVGLKEDFKITYTDNFKENSIFTYIDKYSFRQGIERLLKQIKDYRNYSTDIIFDLKEERDYFTLIILHKDSFFNRKSDNDKILGIQGDLLEVRRYFLNVVDWSVETKLKDGNYYRIIFLEKGKTEYEKVENVNFQKTEMTEINTKPLGVKHIIKIYK